MRLIFDLSVPFLYIFHMEVVTAMEYLRLHIFLMFISHLYINSEFIYLKMFVLTISIPGVYLTILNNSVFYLAFMTLFLTILKFFLSYYFVSYVSECFLTMLTSFLPILDLYPAILTLVIQFISHNPSFCSCNSDFSFNFLSIWIFLLFLYISCNSEFISHF